MGLLDDAIREHLELKRLRGTDPGEIARLEQEALGPVRRTARAAEPAPDPDPGFAEPGIDYEPGAVASADHSELGAPEMAPPPLEHDELHEPSDLYDHGGGEEPAPVPQPPDAGVQSADFEPPVAPPEPPPASPLDAGVPTVEWETPISDDSLGPADSHEPVSDHQTAGTPPGVAGEHPPAEPTEGEGSEDVLEETPDFLQETPEHDRLWFEQRPPRDFDFDK